MSTKVCAAVLVVLALAGCGEDSTTPVVNNSPTIAFTFTPIGVPAGLPKDLTVSVADPDEDDQLTVTWNITRGALAPQNPQRTTMQWAVPVGVGIDTVTVTVSDGERTASVTEILKVCTLARVFPGARFLASQSPYLLRADGTPPRLVVSDARTIEAGVEILVDLQQTTIDVTGQLNIEGTAGNPVIIRANDRTVFCDAGNWWDGILVGSDVTDGVLNMSYAEIWHANHGVRLRDAGSADIQNSIFQCCGQTGVLHEGTGSLLVSDTDIKNAVGNGISASTLTLLPQSITITGCDISINGGAGILLDLNDPSQTVPISIEENKIEFNGVHGIALDRWVWPTIVNNHISSNGSISNVRLRSDFHDGASDNLDLTCNYWGAFISNESTIRSTIGISSSVGATVTVLPWLNQDPYQAQQMPDCTGGQ